MPAEYKLTLNLPKTDFAMKADLPKREPEQLAAWEQAGLYAAIRAARKGQPAFILHDGPPYANGDIHIGHALNKILKDIIVRHATMRGFDSPYVPGWDCHGMPIEHALFKELALTKHQIAQTAFRDKAREYAQRYVDIQRSQFKRLGVMGDWPHPYLTMSPEFELAILRSFKELVRRGLIYRGQKPVYWCPTCETALAEAEVEYENRTDTSIYVAFPVAELSAAARTALGKSAGSPLAVAAWTTTPWTLPANVALCFNPDAPYVVLQASGSPHALIVAEALADRLSQWLPAPVERTGRALGKDLAGSVCRTLYGDRTSVVVTDSHVSLSDGTGVVHIAPGHGAEDYAIGLRYKLPVLSPVDDRGIFTAEAGQWAGQHVKKANPLIVEDLRGRGLLLKEEPITHSYPHCWRCKQPIIFRAAPQWFLRVDDTLRGQLLESAKRVSWVPEAGVSRMTGMLESRPDWCLSRQRYWGSPIPVLHCEDCKAPLLSVEVIGQIEKTLTQRGVEAWFSLSPKELAPTATCPQCHGSNLRKDTDILDVWFDSGVSHEAVLKQRPGLTWPADLYLEGSDQHRGWFQVSLITAVGLYQQPPYRQVLTHGFVMDGEGRKMSKSLGNVVSPQTVIQRYGADILRLWVASSDYSEDIRISDAILERVAEAYRKIRNTIRYLISNLHDFSPARDTQSPETMGELDRWALARCWQVTEEVSGAYERYAFHDAYRGLYHYCVYDLSACYLDALKDRLYTDAADSISRRCGQTALYAILTNLTRLIAPILPVTAEDAWQLMRATGMAEEPSVHLAAWPARPANMPQPEPTYWERWSTLLAVRDVVMKALETQRAAKVIGSPLEADVRLLIAHEPLRQTLESAKAALTEACVVSQLSIEAAGTVPEASETAAAVPGLAGVVVQRAPGEKCARCWKYRPEVGQDAEHPTLCGRCAQAIRHGKHAGNPTESHR